MRIDVFAHVLTPRYRDKVTELLEAQGDQAARNNASWVECDPTLVDLEARWRLMDDLGDGYRQILVMGHPMVGHEPPAVARELAKLGNDELAELVAAHPDRFAGWVAQSALQDDGAGVEVVEEALAAGALGAQTFTSIQGRALDHSDYEPFFELMAQRDKPIWIHPNRMWPDYPLTETEPRYEIYSMAGWPADTTNAMVRLVFAGYLERWPELKIILHHSGGTLATLAGRLKEVDVAGPETDEVAARLKHPPLEYLKRLYADTANNGNPIALRAALEFFGPEHVLFGTDFGFGLTFAPETIEDVETVITDAELKQAVYAGNARRLLELA